MLSLISMALDQCFSDAQWFSGGIILISCWIPGKVQEKYSKSPRKMCKRWYHSLQCTSTVTVTPGSKNVYGNTIYPWENKKPKKTNPSLGGCVWQQCQANY